MKTAIRDHFDPELQEHSMQAAHRNMLNEVASNVESATISEGGQVMYGHCVQLKHVDSGKVN